MWHQDLEKDVEHPTVSLALIYSRHFGLEVSLVCHYRGVKKEYVERREDAVSVGTLPLHKLFWQQNSSKDCWSDSRIRLVSSALERTGTVSNRNKTFRKVLPAAGNVKGFLFFSLSFLPQNKSEAAGFRSRVCTQPGINRAIPRKLMSPQRLIGLRLFRELLIGSCRHKGLYLIGSGRAKGRVRDGDL